jgi:two-component system, response regulator YesN
LYKVLIVDDERPVRRVIQALGKWELLKVDSIYEAAEGESALEVMRQSKPDIVFVDMKMPNMNGADFLHIAVNEFPDAQYIVVSGYDDFDYTRQAIKARVLDYLLKPVIEAELDEVLQKAVSLLDQERENRLGSVLSSFQSIQKDNTKTYLCEIKDYIDNNFHKDIRLSFFSEKYYLSKEYLSRQFREEFGYNIYEYVLMMRMDKARLILAEPGARIHDVSEFLGYKDSNYFSRAFKAYFGISPTEFKESLPNK